MILDSGAETFFIPETGFETEKSPKAENKEVISRLKDFWRHESLGLPDLKKGVLAEQKQMKDFDIKFNWDRYEVSLPWKSTVSEEVLPNNHDLCVGRVKSLQSRFKTDVDLFC